VGLVVRILDHARMWFVLCRARRDPARFLWHAGCATEEPARCLLVMAAQHMAAGREFPEWLFRCKVIR
jgi:hypothetical protein